MKKLIYPFLIILMFTTAVHAQKKELTIKEAVIGQWTSLATENIPQIQWIPETHTYSFQKEDTVFFSSVKSNEQETLITLKELNKIADLSQGDTMDNLPHIEWLSDSVFAFPHENSHYKVNPFDESLEDSVTFPGNASNKDYNRENDFFAYTIDNNLYLISYDGDDIQITNDDNPDIVNGQEVHRREFGINTGTFWSPDGENLAFYRKDESMVTDYPLVDISQRTANIKNTKYPMAGMKSHHVEVGVYNLETGDTIFLETGEPKEKFLTNIQWGPENKYIYIAELNREQNHMKLNQYDASNGEFVQTLFEEKHEKYVEPLSPIRFLPNDNEKFIWHSRRDGYNHIYLYNTDGELLNQLTEGEWEVSASYTSFDKEGKNIYYVSTQESPLERHLYKLNIRSLNAKKITDEPGYHSPKITTDGKFIIDTYSNIQVPRVINILENNGDIQQNLLKSDNPLKDYNLGDTEISTIKTKNGDTDLYYRLIKPSNFDPDKKYPAIIYVYGGPHAQLIHNRWLGGANLWHYYMAQKGYVMLTLDNRGTAGRGLEFENVIHRNLGKNELEDQMQGVKLLKDLGYVDTNRIGVHGWSYGGFMTTTMMLKEPGTFKAGVAGGPVIDWKYYEIMYGERYMDTPEENPAGYEQANLKNYVNNLEGDLLIISGYMDDVVVPQHSLTFLRECVKNDVQVDFFMYPKHQHNVRGKDRIHLMEKITRYFDEKL
ncbi:MAG: DPP IV N-terminal domain-containing protein [Bacteroidales bacterium]